MKNKLIPFLLIGAAVGALISLFDKNTRDSITSKSKDVTYYAKHPKELQQRISTQSSEPSKFDSLKEEVSFWKETIEEIRRNNPELERAVMDAKDTLMENFKEKKANNKQ